MPTRSCPLCAVPLAQRSVTSKYGATLVLDRCPSCRGLWFDRNELYQVTAKGMEEFTAGAADAVAPAAPGGERSRCPACGESLMALSGRNGIPGVEHARYCNGCGGFWLEERDLVGFHQRREEKLAAIREGETRRLAQEALDRKQWECLHGRDPGESPAERGGSEGDAASAATVAGFALSALAPPAVGPLVLVGLSLAERIAPFIADIVAQKLEAGKEDGRALPKSPKLRGGPRNRR
jgi:Zn-finger nucleic acid-binding protein